MNFVLGARGRLGCAIASSLPINLVETPDRFVYAEWWRDGSAELVSRFLEKSAIGGGTVYVAAGLIDPSRSIAEHLQVNFLLAKNVIEGATRLGFRVVTFGTVMEVVAGETSSNSYFLSKVKLGKFVDNFSSKSDLLLHIRLHTLFGGGAPDGFMFLGQMLHSLLSRSDFRMSAGTQLREYHHVDDEVAAIGKLLASGVTGTIALSHSAPVPLKDIATYIFEGFSCSHLLKIGALPEPTIDNYGMVFERPPELIGMTFRETLPALLDYINKCSELLAKKCS